MEYERIVDIHSPESRGYGSGYLVTNRLVLTAKHLTGPSGTTPVFRVTPLQIQNTPASHDFPARLIWASSSADAALLEIEDEAGVPGLRPHPQMIFGRVARDPGKTHPCMAVGFPEARSRGSFNEDCRLTGNLSWTIVDSRLEISIHGAAPERTDLWRGFSGAAVFSGSKLVGVVESVVARYEGRVLRATPVEQLFEDEGFRRCLARLGGDARTFLSGLEGVASPATAAPAAAPARMREYLVDRAHQERAINRYLEQVLDRSIRRPAAFLVYGTFDQCIDTFIDRIIYHTVPRALERHGIAARRADHAIAWPSGNDEPNGEPLLSQLIGALGERLGLRADCDQQSIHERLSRDNAAVIIPCEHTGSWTREDSALMKAWIDWWRRFPDLPEARPLILLHYIPYRFEWPMGPLTMLKVRRIVSDFESEVYRSQSDGRLIAKRLLKLGDVTLADVMTWARDHLPEHDPDDVRRELAASFPRAFRLPPPRAPMHVVVRTLKDRFTTTARGRA